MQDFSFLTRVELVSPAKHRALTTGLPGNFPPHLHLILNKEKYKMDWWMDGRIDR